MNKKLKKNIGIASLISVGVLGTAFYLNKKKEKNSDATQTPKVRLNQSCYMLFHNWNGGRYCTRCGARHPFR